MNEESFRYLACGGSNTVLGWCLVFFLYNYCFDHDALIKCIPEFSIELFGKKLEFAGLVLQSKTFCVGLVALINFVIGFLCMRYIVFVASSLRGRQQLVRYFYMFIIGIWLDYALVITLFTGLLKFPFMPSRIASTCIIVVVSYLAQKYFTFKS